MKKPMKARFRKIILVSLTVAVILSATVFNCSSVNASDLSNKDETISMTPEQVINLDDGGKDYVYTINGVKNIFHVAPPDFNPLTATDEQLQRYGVEPRPKDAQELAEWKDKVKNFKGSQVGKTIELHKQQVSSYNAIKSADASGFCG